MNYIISESQIKAIILYLQERPYKEVADGIAMLSNLPKQEVEQRSKAKPWQYDTKSKVVAWQERTVWRKQA